MTTTFELDVPAEPWPWMLTRRARNTAFIGAFLYLIWRTRKRR